MQIGAIIGVLIGLCFSAQSADRYKAGNSTALDQAASWTGGMVPGASDTAVYAGLGALSTELGSDLSWLGIVATNNSGLWTISAGNTLTLGAGGVTTGGGSSGGFKIYSVINQSENAIYDAGNGRNILLYGGLAGNGNIEKTGNGTLSLTGDGSGYSGTMTVSSALLSIGSDNALGTGNLVLNGGMLNAGAATRTVANPVSVTADSKLEAVNSSRNLIMTGVISGDASSALSVVNVGEVTLSGDNTFAGGVRLGTSKTTTLIAGHDHAFGTGTLTVSGAGGKLGTTSSLDLDNDIALSAGLDIISSDVLRLNGIISGAGTLVKSGSGNLSLSEDNSGFSGGVTLDAGVLAVGHINALGTGVLTINGGKLNASTTDRTVANDIFVAGDAIFEAVNTSRDLTLDGVVSGPGTVEKTNAGTVTFNGNNTYTNTTTVSGGALIVNGSLASRMVAVKSGAGLGGSGSLQSAEVMNGAMLEPGPAGPGTLAFAGSLSLEAGAMAAMEIASAASHDSLQGSGSSTLQLAGTILLDFTGNTAVDAGDLFDVLQVATWGTVQTTGASLEVAGLPDGLSVDADRFSVEGLVEIVAAEPAGDKAVGLFYAGFYHGAGMAEGLYRFTDPSRPLETATRIETVLSPASTWRGIGFDGSGYIAIKQGAGGLYRNNGVNTLFSRISGSYSYSDWHGIDRCNGVYYGIYDGSSQEGPGLYVFYDPADPENTGVKLCTNQVFFSAVWTDVAFDGQRYLFVRSDADGGTPGIYQYDPATDQFALISGAETYCDWDGLAVFDSDIAPLLNRKVYLLLFGGQSNALGWGYHQYLLDTADPLQNPQDDIDFLYRRPYGNTGMLPVNTLIPLQSGNSNTGVKQPGEYPALTNAPISRFGPELTFARTVRDGISIPDSKVAIMKYAYGGSGLYNPAHWLPDGTANRSADAPLYQRFQQTVWRTIAALKNKYPTHDVEILGMGWEHGGSDALDGHGSEYETNLTLFVQDIRATFGENLPFVLSKLSPNQGSVDLRELVRAGQQAVADADPFVEATETLGTNYLTSVGLSEGQGHYKTPGLMQIGRDLGNALLGICGLDSDSDGLPDAWENSYPPGAAGLGGTPEADFDQDGLTDREEFRIGTSPVDPADRLELSLDSALTGRWQASRDVAYTVLQSTNLATWTELGAPVLLRNAGGLARVDFSKHVAAADGKGFFKLLVE